MYSFVFLCTLILLEGLLFADPVAKTEHLIREFEDKLQAPNISATKLKKLMKSSQDKLVLVDVREPYEQRVSMIPGAITREAFEDKKSSYKDYLIISYCTIGYRSSKYTNLLRIQGFQAFNLRGSLLAWTHVNGRLIDSKGNSTNKLHVYGKKWDTASEHYKTFFD